MTERDWVEMLTLLSAKNCILIVYADERGAVIKRVKKALPYP